MMNHFGRIAVAVALGVTIGGGIPGAFAQAPRSKVDAAVSPGAPEFRDPKTGQIWTPNNVGEGSGPVTAEDKAFNPSAQGTVIGNVRQQTAVTPLGTVPITAGPTVPIVDIAISSFGMVPGRRWQSALYLSNNSASAVKPVVDCAFTNGGKTVQTTQAVLPEVGGGVRVGFAVYGPPASVFVDHASCNVVAP
jgi:hypothetical protein